MVKQHPTFKVAIEQALRRKGWTIKRLAGAVGVKHATLRTCMRRNRFKASAAAAISAQLGLAASADEVLEKFALEGDGFIPEREAAEQKGTVPAWVANMGRESERLRRQFLKGLDEYCTGARLMKEGDIQVVMTETVTPIEMEYGKEGIALRRAIAEAISRGALFLYLRPHADLIKANAAAWHFARTVSYDQSVQEVDALRTWIAQYLQEHKKMGAEEAAAAAATATPQYYMQSNAFFAAGFSMSLLHTFDDSGAAVTLSSVRVPGTAGIVVTKNEVFEWRLIRVALRAAEWESERLQGLEDGPEKRQGERTLRKVRELLRDARPLANEAHSWGP
jgi:hypothetical protein